MATNLTPWGFFIGGEELHNNHHAFPSSAKFALRKFEFDIGWAFIRVFETLRLAKVLRVAPSLDVRPNMPLPDAETLKALLTHRFQVMTDYFKGVIAPTLREEAAHAGESIKALPRALRKALANGGRWLDEHSRERLQEVVKQRPLLSTVCEFRTRLATCAGTRQRWRRSDVVEFAGVVSRSGSHRHSNIAGLRGASAWIFAGARRSLIRHTTQTKGGAKAPPFYFEFISGRPSVGRSESSSLRELSRSAVSPTRYVSIRPDDR